MDRVETLKIVGTLREAYPNGAPITENTINLWEELLRPYEYEVVWHFTLELCREWTGYTMPPPAALIRKIEGAKDNNLDIDLWNEAEYLISRGTIITAEEFENASPEIKRYFGSIARIKELALMPSGETANERARFLKQVPSIRESIRTREALPPNVLKMIDGVTERKQLT